MFHLIFFIQYLLLSRLILVPLLFLKRGISRDTEGFLLNLTMQIQSGNGGSYTIKDNKLKQQPYSPCSASTGQNPFPCLPTIPTPTPWIIGLFYSSPLPYESWISLLFFCLWKSGKLLEPWGLQHVNVICVMWSLNTIQCLNCVSDWVPCSHMRDQGGSVWIVRSPTEMPLHTSSPAFFFFFFRGGGRIWIACPDIIYFITIYLCHEINCGLLCDILFYALKLLCHPFLLRGIKHWSCITPPPPFLSVSYQFRYMFVLLLL